MIKVRVLQVDQDPENTDELAAGVAAGHTVKDGWQMPMDSAPGDLVVWYAAGRQRFVARGWVEARPRKVEKGQGQGHGPYRGPVAGVGGNEGEDVDKGRKSVGVGGGRVAQPTMNGPGRQ